MAVILLLSIVGLILYYFERKNHFKRTKFAQEYIASIKENIDLKDEEKKEKIKEFFLANGFNIITIGKDLIFRKKDFSLGLFLFGSGIFLVGGLVYLLYYRYIQKEDEFKTD
ncbi:MAG: hypothetical protein OIF32_12340 [Campylobacterales bacterium]|nr:hypothetical protein [Campylobacterales bacterium]